MARDGHNQRNRRKIKDPKVKIGHGGTLDPLATGVLIAGIGSGTKSLQDFLLCTKTYEATILFGTGTDSYDRLGKVLAHAPTEHITKEMVEKALDQFRGKFKQLPPLFSALKMNGKPLYEYARQNLPIPREIERRPVEVLDLEMLEWMEPGTHNHKPPTDEAGHAEINLAKRVWEQESEAPLKASNDSATEKEAQEQFETRKRKLSEDQDELVQEQPKSRRKTSPASKSTSDEAAMSGGLADPTESATEPTAEKDDAIIAQSIEAVPASPESKGPPAARISMTVTSGFYVRSLCHDLGVAVGSAALMAELQRTRQGQFSLGHSNVIEYSDLKKPEEVWGPKIEAMIKAWETSEREKGASAVTDAAGNTKKEEPKSEKNPQITDEEVKNATST